MKVFITFVFFKIALSGVGQDLAFIKKSLDLIESPGEFKPDSSGLFRLPEFNYSCVQNIMNDDREDENYFQLLDLDKDKQYDILFSGPCNPYSQVGIFLSRGTYFQNVFDRGGDIVAIDQNKSASKIFVLYQGCCGDINKEITEITVDDKSNLTLRTIQFVDSTRPTEKIKLKKLVVKGVLRKTPTIDDEPYKDPDSENWFVGNQIYKWDQPKEVIQLQTEGVWSLVIAEKEKNVSVLGWIMRSK